MTPSKKLFYSYRLNPWTLLDFYGVAVKLSNNKHFFDVYTVNGQFGYIKNNNKK